MNDITARKTGTWALLLAGFTGAASALFLAFVPPAVAGDRFSFPLSADGFTAIQSFFFLHHLAIAWGLMVVWRSGFAGRGVPARIGGIGSVVSMVLLAVQELVAISVANAAYPSPATDIVDSVYGVLSLLNGVALIVLGVAVVRARRWAGWRRFIPLTLGVYVIVPLTPAIFGPFVVARLTIGVWMLLFAALGFALVRTDAIPAKALMERL